MWFGSSWNRNGCIWHQRSVRIICIEWYGCEQQEDVFQRDVMAVLSLSTSDNGGDTHYNWGGIPQGCDLRIVTVTRSRVSGSIKVRDTYMWRHHTKTLYITGLFSGPLWWDSTVHITGEFLQKVPVMRSLHFCFAVSTNKLLRKLSSCCDLRCNVTVVK